MNSYLEARDQRQQALSRFIGEGHPTVLSLSLNIAGADKLPPGSAGLFAWALREIRAVCAPGGAFEVSQDALGHFAIIASGRDPLQVKRLAVALEEAKPAARLVDLDVYRSGEQIGRSELGLPARTCLLCDQAAVDCMRSKRHSPLEVIAKAHELLANFKA